MPGKGNSTVALYLGERVKRGNVQVARKSVASQHYILNPLLLLFDPLAIPPLDVSLAAPLSRGNRTNLMVSLGAWINLRLPTRFGPFLQGVFAGFITRPGRKPHNLVTVCFSRD